jgi:hypothetical protein
VFILGNLYAPEWPLTFISMLLMLLFIYQHAAKFLRQTRLIQTIAAVSMPLFFINGFLRSPFRLISIHFGRWYVTVVTGLAFAVFSVCVAYILLKVEQRLFGRRPARVAELAA